MSTAPEGILVQHLVIKPKDVRIIIDACTSTFKFDYTMEMETISSRNHIVKSTKKKETRDS